MNVSPPNLIVVVITCIIIGALLALALVDAALTKHKSPATSTIVDAWIGGTTIWVTCVGLLAAATIVLMQLLHCNGWLQRC